ncbi:unnamed protein product, partial [Iphiclides podalirius]
MVFTFLVNRHGDRTPVKQNVYLSDKPEALEKITQPLGYGQLTDLGKRRAYELGNFIRSRYGDYLSPNFNLSEIYIRSTDSTRAKMTVLVAMAAVYRPDGDSWSDDINWVPVPYTTVPLRYDFLMGMNCPTFDEHFNEMSTTYRPEMATYHQVVNQLSSILRRDLSKTPVKMYSAYDVFISQIHLGIPVKPSIQKVMPEIKSAADKAFDILFGNDTMLPMQAGLLLKEFFDVASAAISGEPTKKVRIYSAHDTTVYAFEAISRATPRQGAPMYAAAFALELRRVKETGRYIVVPVYLKSPGEPLEYLHIEGCEALCDLEQFYEITAPFLLDEDERKRRCKYNENAPFDDKGYA